MFAVLNRLEFVTWIKILSELPTSKINVNGLLSPTFQLFRRTRQGGPLVPLLFSIYVESLICAIKQHRFIE